MNDEFHPKKALFSTYNKIFFLKSLPIATYGHISSQNKEMLLYFNFFNWVACLILLLLLLFNIRLITTF